MAQHDGAMGKREYVDEVMADQKDCLPFLVQPADEAIDLGRLTDAKRGGRLVHQRRARRFEERPRHGDALALAAAQLGHRHPNRGKIDAETRDRSGGFPDHALAVDDDAEARRHAPEEEVVRDIALIDERQVLKNGADAELARTMRVVDPLVLAVDPDRSRIRLGDAREDRDEGRLSGTVVADQREYLAGMGRDVDAVERRHMTEELGDATRLKERLPRRSGLEGLADEDLDRLLFPPAPVVYPRGRPPADWPALHRELKRPGVTLSLLWEEYRAVHPDGYGYSQFCARYRAWKGKLDVTMRQSHVAGEKMFVDYAGATAEVIDPESGEVHEAQIFVATLGASSYTYAEATWTQGLPNWIGSHTRAFAYFDGVPAQVVPDNLKSGVVKACLYDPEINRTYADLAAHYDTAIVPARPRKPRDKAKVEVGVQLVERWILARLRNRRFFSLAELNQAIRELLETLNGRVTKHLGASRRQLFEALDCPALQPLPAQAYQYAEWKQRRAGLDYHVEVAKHYYSVPHALAKQKLWARITERTVEVFHKGRRVAAHMRGSGNRRHTTVAEHMPSAHRRYASWTLERIRREATANGTDTEALIDRILRTRPHPEQGFRTCIGILRLAKSHGGERLEAACERALEIGAQSYSSVVSILKNNLDRHKPASSAKGAATGPAIDHANIRGPHYFQ